MQGAAYSLAPEQQTETNWQLVNSNQLNVESSKLELIDKFLIGKCFRMILLGNFLVLLQKFCKFFFIYLKVLMNECAEFVAVVHRQLFIFNAD